MVILLFGMKVSIFLFHIDIKVNIEFNVSSGS